MFVVAEFNHFIYFFSEGHIHEILVYVKTIHLCKIHPATFMTDIAFKKLKLSYFSVAFNTHYLINLAAKTQLTSLKQLDKNKQLEFK